MLQEHFYDAEGNSGYIAWRLKTVQRNNHCSRTTSDDKCERRGPRTERVFSTTEKQLEGDRCQEAISFLKHCSDPEQVTAKMKSTFQYRQKMIHDPEKSSSVLSLFPRFLDTKGLVSVAHNRLLLQHLVMFLLLTVYNFRCFKTLSYYLEWRLHLNFWRSGTLL